MTMNELVFTPGKLQDFFKYFDRENPKHLEAIDLLQKHVTKADPSLMVEKAEWVEKFRSVNEPTPTLKVDNTWAGITQAAASSGAKFPELVAAQWALESGFGKYSAGTFNYWGIKATGRSPGTLKTTQEFINNEWITIEARFQNFASIQEAVDYLVARWYKDFGKTYKGVNRAATRDEAAKLLVIEKYATDPTYSSKLISLLNQYAPNGAKLASPPPAVKEVTYLELPVPFFSQLDSETDQGSRMCFSSTCAMAVEYLKPGVLKGSQKDDFYLKKVQQFGDTTNSQAQIKALQAFGIKASFRTDLDLSDIKIQLGKGLPVPIGVLHKGPSSAPTGSGHWILIVGLNETHFLANDPFGEMDVAAGGYLKNTNGNHLKYSIKNLTSRWNVEGPGTGWGIQLAR